MINKLLLAIKTPKTLIAATLLLLFSSTALYAHSSCDVDLKAGLTINESKLEFFESKNKQKILYTIANKHNLIVRGEGVSLTAEQQALVEQYSRSIRAMVPQVRHLAIEGVDLAIEGVNLAFNELLGEGNNAGVGLTQELSSLKKEIAEQFTIEHGFTLGENGLEENELLGNDFEQRIESSVEKAVMSSMGTLLVTLGKQVFSGGDTGAFETRMESFGENVEREMALRAEKIKRKADSLCTAAIEIDQLEEKLKSSITPLVDINVITVKQSRGHGEHDKRLM